MLESLYQIGRVQEIDILNDLVLKIDERYEYILKIQFRNLGNTFQFENIDFEKNDQTKKNRYMLLKTSSSAPAKTPCAIWIDLDKTFKKKIMRSIKKFINDFKPKDKYKKWLLNLNDEMIKKSDEIESALKNFIKLNEEIAKKNKVLLITVLENDEEKYPGDIKAFVESIKSQGKNAYIPYYEKNKIKSIGKINKYCYFCGQYKDEVWGYASPFAFYTVDKVSFISGGFNPIFAWKNYPVCPDCALALHAGASYVENCLRFTFTGYNYFLLPKLLNFNDNQMRDLLKRLKNYESFWLDESKKSRIQRTENFILRKLSNWENIVNFNFLMYRKTNAEFNILLFLQEIPPTRLKKIIKAQDNINQNYSFLLSVLNNVKYEENLFYVLKGFFIGDKEDLDFQKAYLSIIRGIFYLKPINLELLLNRFMAKIRREMYKKSKLTAKVSVINGLRIILFFKELNILTKRRSYMQNIRGPYNEYFERYPIFEDAVQKALFLEGVLAGRLLNIQYNNRGSEPFFDRLNGLKIDEKIAKRVLPEMINKLEEYNENKKYLKEIESAISFYFMNSNFCSYSIDELSFYFSLGLTQYHDFLQFILNSEKEDNNKEDMNE